MIKKVLVCIDGSDYANRALNFALDLAHKYSAEIQLLTVVPPIFLPATSLEIVKTEAIADATLQLENSFRKILAKAEEKAKKTKPNLRVSTKFEQGSPDEKIIETANRGGFDIVVMGSRGVGHRHYHIGSVSERVVDQATCPVLIVK